MVREHFDDVGGIALNLSILKVSKTEPSWSSIGGFIEFDLAKLSKLSSQSLSFELKNSGVNESVFRIEVCLQK